MVGAWCQAQGLMGANPELTALEGEAVGEPHRFPPS